MIYEMMKKRGAGVAADAVRRFLRSYYYIGLIALLMVCANLFGIELAVFCLYLGFGILIVLFDSDLRGIIPIACCSYMTISEQNNPALHPEDAAFYATGFKTGLTVVIILAGALLLVRFLSLVIGGERKKFPMLAVGFFALGLSLMIGGIFSPFYEFRTALFGFTVFASLCGLYFLFYYGVDWKSTDKTLFAQVFLAIGAGVLIEIVGMYLKSGILTNPELNRASLVTGWGMYNNVGCVMAMCIPAALYFSLTKKSGWIFTIVGVLFLIGLFATQSRGSILFGGIVYLAGTVLVLVKAEKGEKKWHFAALGGALLLFLVLFLVFREEILRVIADVIEKTQGEDASNGRWTVYENGMNQFKGHPFFGVGFYQCTADRWGYLSEDAFLPRRYHDTYIQLLATGGIFALGCYAVHRFETVVLFLRKFTVEKMFIALSILALLLTSILDCHFFNLGPGLLYSVLLVCAEGQTVAMHTEPLKTDKDAQEISVSDE